MKWAPSALCVWPAGTLDSELYGLVHGLYAGSSLWGLLWRHGYGTTWYPDSLRAGGSNSAGLSTGQVDIVYIINRPPR